MFQKAQPIWLKNRQTEVHLCAQFKTVCPPLSQAYVHIATSGHYQLRVNGSFVAFGPNRAGKGHFRMDRINISGLLTQQENVIVLEVCGYNAFSFELQKQPSFLQCEVMDSETAIAWTGSHFSARVHPFRRRKTQRYSFQRIFSEAYNITGTDTFLWDRCPGDAPLEITEPKVILPRSTPYPQYEISEATPQFSGIMCDIVPQQIRQDRAWLNVSDEALTGFPIAQLEVFPTAECQHFDFQPNADIKAGHLQDHTYTVYRLPRNMTGMLRFQVSCTEPVTLYVMFDEVLLDGKIDFLRMECANSLRYDLCPGVHKLQTFNVYTMQYLQFAAVNGSCTITDPVMIQYKHPPVSLPFKLNNPQMQRIADAAVDTFLQNAIDVFSDCPSRERGGWLCDSFFIARVAHLLTGNVASETAFLENFLHEEHYAALPEGMFPMCYPADHMDGVFIPQWAMWLVIELAEYHRRGGEEELIRRYEPRIRKLLEYFRGFENEYGLLEDLDGWNFVEWSQANQLTKNVNYPTNMLYCATLRSVSSLYGDDAVLQKADRIMDTVRAQSFDGQFFVDNAVRKDGKLVPSGERTEVCQYYAFFFGAATAQTHPQLLKLLVEEFGPDRTARGAWPEIYPANAFIGNYLRLDILMQLGYYDTVVQNIEGYFLYMADTTGTLWENIGSTASCNHGFASYVLYWLSQL